MLYFLGWRLLSHAILLMGSTFRGGPRYCFGSTLTAGHDTGGSSRRDGAIVIRDEQFGINSRATIEQESSAESQSMRSQTVKSNASPDLDVLFLLNRHWSRTL